MKIETIKEGGFTRLIMDGRFDASWCDHLRSVLDETIRRGEHHLQLDLAEVHYLSSAGIRLLLKTYKQLKAIQGTFQIVNPSENTANVLRLAGLDALLADSSTKNSASQSKVIAKHESTSAIFEIHGHDVPPVKVTAHDGEPKTFSAPAFLIGVGAIGRDATDNAHRLGELLAIGGNVAYQPTDGAKQPDYMVTHGALKADAQIISGIAASALPAGLTRFETHADDGVIGLLELAETILCIAKSNAAIVVAMTETAGLIGAALRQSLAATDSDEHLQFPAIRDWLSFSADRIHRDSTTLLVGVVAKPGTPIESQLRPLDADGKTLGHFHAAAFPYHPLQKGEIDLAATINAAFEDRSIQAVLHLLADHRPLVGAGESQFYRGACWYAPANF
ncbi:STAS domain-containing protein [Cerasicoccus fimbriatus]|uniref:STAS domain-containing protein n=1 Tax=Cerasicoccus fimbriatus TaxID=3014554 RepID=UPI0022B50B3E|nr:STAS domain-containing protein [Cerasicoccus sp. TK19100]